MLAGRVGGGAVLSRIAGGIGTAREGPPCWPTPCDGWEATILETLSLKPRLFGIQAPPRPHPV